MNNEEIIDGYYLYKNHKDAFNKTVFLDRYVKDAFVNHEFIVGDLSGGELRLKGFNSNKQKQAYFRRIPEYLIEHCQFDCPHFILIRGNLTREEIRKLK